MHAHKQMHTFQTCKTCTRSNYPHGFAIVPKKNASTASSIHSTCCSLSRAFAASNLQYMHTASLSVWTCYCTFKRISWWGVSCAFAASYLRVSHAFAVSYLQPPICGSLVLPLSCLCSLLFAASYLQVSPAPSLVPLQPPICESLMPLQSPMCSLLFASLSCSLSRAFAASYLRVYRILDAGRRLELLHKTQVDGGPVSFWMTEQMVPSGAMNWKWASQQWRPSEMLHKTRVDGGPVSFWMTGWVVTVWGNELKMS